MSRSKISFTRLKIGDHVMELESYIEYIYNDKDPPIVSWVEFKGLLKDKFYHLGHHAKQFMK